MMREWLLMAGVVWAGAASAAVEGPGRNQFLHAARASGPVAVDENSVASREAQRASQECSHRVRVRPAPRVAVRKEVNSVPT